VCKESINNNHICLFRLYLKASKYNLFTKTLSEVYYLNLRLSTKGLPDCHHTKPNSNFYPTPFFFFFFLMRTSLRRGHFIYPPLLGKSRTRVKLPLHTDLQAGARNCLHSRRFKLQTLWDCNKDQFMNMHP